MTSSYRQGSEERQEGGRCWLFRLQNHAAARCTELKIEEDVVGFPSRICDLKSEIFFRCVLAARICI